MNEQHRFRVPRLKLHVNLPARACVRARAEVNALQILEPAAERPPFPAGRRSEARNVMQHLPLRTIAVAMVCVCSAVAADSPREPGRNLAKGTTYTLAPTPDYPHCTDAGDRTQLTDGKLTEGYFWTQPGTVGWQHPRYAAITLDLGRIEPIAGVSFRTAAGVAGVTWPAVIRIHVSDDGKQFHDVGDLMELDTSARPLPAGYAVIRLATHSLRTRGRYVRFLVIPMGPYLFCDEVEVFRGDDAFASQAPTSRPVGTPEESYLQYKVESGVRQRFEADAAAIERAIRESKLDAGIRDAMQTRCAEVRQRLLSTVGRLPGPAFKAVLPYNPEHAELFGLQAALWKAGGSPELSAWTAAPWDPVDLHAPPAADTARPLSVHMMLGEYRAAAFNLANATNRPMRVSFSIEGLPGSPAPSFVTCSRLPWTDTISRQPVTAALMELAPDRSGWSVEVQPGLVQQIWLTFHPIDVKPGKYTGRIVVNRSEDSRFIVPLEFNLHPLTFPTRTTLWLGGWGYTDGEGKYGITPANHKAFVDHLRGRFVNAPWATAQVMMQFKFDGDTPQLDTALFDDWLAQWPDARAYLVFLSVDRTFAGQQMGTAPFEQKVKSWISAWARHLAGKGVSADRLGLLLVDEPRTPSQDEIIVAWAKAIHAAEPKVLIWEDPIYQEPREGRREMFELSDILCPNRPMWLAAGKPFEDFYLDQQKRGRTLQLYSCSGPVKLLDPYTYYRLQAWHCWQIKATGTFFWAFGDNSRASSWNEYAAPFGPFTPLFLDADSVTGGKHMEAIRESVEDYEYFVMLKALVKRASEKQQSPQTLAEAKELLDHAADEVLQAAGTKELVWHAPKDRSRADNVRIRMLETMTRLADAGR